jgi:hypothetical protein
MVDGGVALVTRMTGICVSRVFFFSEQTRRKAVHRRKAVYYSLYVSCTGHVDERQQSLSRLRHTRILRVSINAVIVWIAIHKLHSIVSDIFK